MAVSQELMQAITDLQLNAQERLPVLPNNGNPRGANNMPQNPIQNNPNTGVVPPDMRRDVADQNQKPTYAYPWLAPSPSVERIRGMLAGPQQPQPINLNQQQPVSQAQPMVPILPARRGQMY